MLLTVLALRQDGRNNAVHAVGNVGRFTNAVEVVAVAGWPQRQQKRGVLWEGTSKILRVLLDDLVDLGGGGGGGVREIGLYDTCWLYSLCNFQYRHQDEQTCSLNVDC